MILTTIGILFDLWTHLRLEVLMYLTRGCGGYFCEPCSTSPSEPSPREHNSVMTGERCTCRDES